MTARDRILIARLDSAGDVLLAGPAVRAVARSGAEVVFLTSSRAEPAARLLPGVDRVITFDAPWILARPPQVDAAAVRRLIGAIAALRPSAAILLTSLHQSALPLALLLRLAGVGRLTACSEDYPGSLLDHRVSLGEHLHEAERAVMIAHAAGFERVDPRLAVIDTLPPVDGLGGIRPYVVVHPGADAPARQWPARCARAAARGLAARGHRVVVTGGPRERPLTAEVAGDHALDLGGRTDWAQLAAVMGGASAVVVGNTGPAHLAAALGVPVVSLFAPTVPLHRWGPFGVPTVVLGDQGAACAGTRARECPVPDHPCLSGIPAEHVVSAVDHLIRSTA